MDRGYAREAHPKSRILRSSGNKSNDENCNYKEQKTLRSRISQRENEQHKNMMEKGFFIEQKQNSYTRSPLFLPHLTGNYKLFLGSLLH
jgi:hypothetical protein